MGFWFQSVRAMFFLFQNLKRVFRSHANTGFCFSFLLVFLSVPFLEGPFSVSFQLFAAFGVPKGFFGTLSTKLFFHEKVAPSFLHTI